MFARLGEQTGQLPLMLERAALQLGTEVQRRATHQLNLERTLAQHPPGRLAGDGERLGQQVVEALPVLMAFAELVGLGAQLVVAELLHLRGQGLDVLGQPVEALDHAAFTEAQKFRQH